VRSRSYLKYSVVLGDINMGTWPSRLGKSQMRDLDPRVIALARLRSNCMSKLQTNPLVREGAQHQEPQNFLAEKKNLVMSSRWEPDTKIDWPTDRRSHFNLKLLFKVACQ
jgi:hypothetical protein